MCHELDLHGSVPRNALGYSGRSEIVTRLIRGIRSDCGWRRYRRPRDGCAAQKLGYRCALLESHTKLGGCAGYFSRGPYTFDAGATALMGLGAGEPIGDLLATIGVAFEGVRTPTYRVVLPDRSFEIVPDVSTFEQSALASFPGFNRNQRAFWRLQKFIGQTLFSVSSRVPRLPLRSFGDLAYDLKILGLKGMFAGALSLLTVRDVMQLLGLYHDVPFRSLIAMLLQDTAQAGPEKVPFANAAVCIEAYRLGMSRPRGGMKSLAEGIGERFANLEGDLRTSTLVDRVEVGANGGFEVITRRRDRIKTRQIALNLPIDLAAKLLGRSLEGRLGRRREQSRAVWSAFTGYVAFDRQVIPDTAPLFHQVLQSYDDPIDDGNNVLVSLSPPDDPGYGPTDVRVATMSTHTLPAEWASLDPEAYAVKKQVYVDRLIGALKRAIPEAPDHLVHAEFASPKSFARYTRRIDGAVGGPPVSRRNSNFLAVDSDVFGKGIWLVGDSVFPGQGTMASVLSAIRVVERISGRTWSEIRRGLIVRPRAVELAGVVELTSQSLE